MQFKTRQYKSITEFNYEVYNISGRYGLNSNFRAAVNWYIYLTLVKGGIHDVIGGELKYSRAGETRVLTTRWECRNKCGVWGVQRCPHVSVDL
jgi:hypothetical protein